MIREAAARVWRLLTEAMKQAELPLRSLALGVLGVLLAISPVSDWTAAIWLPLLLLAGFQIWRSWSRGTFAAVWPAAKRTFIHAVHVDERDVPVAARVLLTWDVVMLRSGGAYLVDGRTPRGSMGASEKVDGSASAFQPRIAGMSSSRRGLVVLIDVPVGLDVERYMAESTYAAAWGVATVEADQMSPGVVRLVLYTGDDPLEQPVDWDQLPRASADLGAPVPFAVDDQGQAVELQRAHTLVLGATGSGKGSGLWAVVNGLAPAAERGLVRFVGLDSKASEVRQAEGLFCEVGYTADEHAEVFEKLASLVQERGDAHQGREFTATPEQPLMVVVIDEITSLTSIFKDAKARNSAMADLRIVLSLGRSRGIVVIGAGQDPTKESMPLRNLFPQVVALRLRDQTETRVALGEGALEAGARPHDIRVASASNGYATAGVGYVQTETGEFVRMRTPYMSDDGLAELERQLGDHSGHSCQRDSEKAEQEGT